MQRTYIREPDPQEEAEAARQSVYSNLAGFLMTVVVLKAGKFAKNYHWKTIIAQPTCLVQLGGGALLLSVHMNEVKKIH